MAEYELRIRVVVQAPPPGVAWALQVGRAELLPPAKRSADLEFETSVRVVTAGDGALDFRGSAVQGPKHGRFLYLNSGVRAGQSASPWDRRAKVSLEGLRPLLGGRGQPPHTVSAAIGGTGKDGGPACASVPLVGPGWRPEPRRRDRPNDDGTDSP